MRDERAVSLEVRNLHLDTRRSRQQGRSDLPSAKVRASLREEKSVSIPCHPWALSGVQECRSDAALRSADNSPFAEFLII